MSEPIVSRQQIAGQAAAAARLQVKFGDKPVNPFPIGSDAHAAFEASLARYLHEYSAPTAEASA
jgi:hypothetical protein